MPPGISAEARAFVRGCLTRDPARRLTAQQMLSHAWIRAHERRALSEDEAPGPKAPEEAREELDGGTVYFRGGDDAGARLGRHKSASAGFFPAAEAALAERGGEGDAGPSARLPSLDHGGGLRSQSVTNVVGENLKRGLGRVREFLFWEQRGRSNRGRGGDDAEHDMGA